MTAFGKHPAFLVHEDAPFNAEPPLALLRGSFVTPAESFYVRNHGDVPEVDAATYRLSVAGSVERPLELSLDDLRERFPVVTIAATLGCAGNRRTQLMEIRSIPGEIPWRDGAIGNAHWTGVALREVLAATGVAPEAKHVAFEGLDAVEAGGTMVTFGGSIPLAKALAAETLLAYEMNGEPLAPVHGFPLRVVVPGYIGARSVKWLSRISVQSEPSANYFQARAYKLFPADVAPDDIEWSTGVMLGELPVNSAICRPGEGETVPAGTVEVEGWAMATASVERVDISSDRGRTWVGAEVLHDGGPWTWRFWRAAVELEPGSRELVARATDAAGNTQPEAAETTWNAKGYVNNAWPRVTLTVAERGT